MTRDEFMLHAELEIDQAFRSQKNRMMNLVEQAWAEGKRNAEINGVITIVKDALERLGQNGAFEEQKPECDGIDFGG